MSKKIKWSNRLTERSSESFSAPFVKWVKQREAAAYINQITKERDEARECLREIIGGFAVCGCHVPSIYAHETIPEETLSRWRKAAGLEEQ